MESGNESGWMWERMHGNQKGKMHRVWEIEWWANTGVWDQTGTRGPLETALSTRPSLSGALVYDIYTEVTNIHSYFTHTYTIVRVCVLRCVGFLGGACGHVCVGATCTRKSSLLPSLLTESDPELADVTSWLILLANLFWGGSLSCQPSEAGITGRPPCPHGIYMACWIPELLPSSRSFNHWGISSACSPLIFFF